MPMKRRCCDSNETTCKIQSAFFTSATLPPHCPKKSRSWVDAFLDVGIEKSRCPYHCHSHHRRSKSRTDHCPKRCFFALIFFSFSLVVCFLRSSSLSSVIIFTEELGSVTAHLPGFRYLWGFELQNPSGRSPYFSFYMTPLFLVLLDWVRL
jgi:hypothetical protein